jgi:HNH endonuclease
MTSKAPPNQSKLDSIVAKARRYSSEREASYREQALKLYPWVCGRCAREFSGTRLSELTVHHRDHNHENNPLDGSNWELLCIYCHENEHARILDESLRGRVIRNQAPVATHHPFSDLQAKLNKKNETE